MNSEIAYFRAEYISLNAKRGYAPLFFCLCCTNYELNFIAICGFCKKGVDKGTKICYYIGAKEIKTKTKGLRFLGESII